MRVVKVQVVVVAVLVVVVTGVLLFRFRWKPANLPPGPPALPLVGSLHLLGTHPHHNLAAMARKYGPLMSVRLGQKLTIVVSSPDAAREFLKYQDINFCVRPRTMAAELFMPKGRSHSQSANESDIESVTDWCRECRYRV